jgi:hypothetical protein
MGQRARGGRRVPLGRSPAPPLVAGEDDYGEFRNPDGEFSGKFYVRYQFQEEGEYFDEKVVMV